MRKLDPCEYVRKYYGVPARIGMHVTLSARPGVIKGATHHVRILLAGDKSPVFVHPTDPALIYINNDGSQAWPA